MTIEELRALCITYDKKYGDYVESSFEGEAVFYFILEELGMRDRKEFMHRGFHEDWLKEMGWKQ